MTPTPVSFSKGQWSLIKIFHTEAITALIKKIENIFGLFLSLFGYKILKKIFFWIEVIKTLSFNEKEIRKIPMIFDIENRLWMGFLLCWPKKSKKVFNTIFVIIRVLVSFEKKFLIKFRWPLEKLKPLSTYRFLDSPTAL